MSWLGGYLYRQPIQIFHDRVVDTENNVPILVKLRNTNFDFASARADGFDVRFAMFDGTLLHFERERHDQAAQKAEYFVNVPIVHAGVDTFFYIYYGKSDAVDGQFPTLVWDANFNQRLSMKENPAGPAPQIRDSTVNANHGTAHGCLPQDTFIKTDCGIRKIIDIKIGDKVYTYTKKGIKLKAVTNTFNNGVKEVYELKTANRNIRATLNHKFLTLKWLKRERVSGYNWDKKHPFSHFQNEYDLVWKSLKNIEKGDIIVIYNGHELKEINSNYSKDFITFIGCFLGDGSISHVKGDNRIRLSLHDKNLIEKYSSILEREKIKHSKDDKLIYIYNKDLFELFSELGLHEKAHTKNIPNWIWKLSREYKEALIEGIIDSDGWKTEYGYSIELCNELLTKQLRELCIELGYRVSNVNHRVRKATPLIQRTHQDIKYSESWGLSWTVNGTKDNSHMRFDVNKIRRRIKCNIPSEFQLQKVISKKKIGEENVYDIEVDDSHNFIAEGVVVHNSMTSAQSVEGKIGRALDFDGVDDKVNIAHSPSLDVTTSYTLSLNIFPHIVNSERMMLWRGSGNISDIEFYIRNTDTIVLHNRRNGGVLNILSFSNPPANAWTHITVSYEGSLATWRVYYNGLEVSTTLLTGNGNPPLDSNLSWRIGDTDHTGFVNGGQFDGLIDEVRISNIARSASWIALQYHSMNDTLLQLGNVETGVNLVDGAIANVIATCAETLQHDSRHSQATAFAIANTTTLREFLLQQHAIATPIATSVDVDWKLYVLMNDIDVSEKIDDLDVSLAMSERSSCSFTFKSLTAPVIGENVEVRYSTIIIFSGTIEDISQEDNIFQTEYKFKIDCIDYTKILDRIIITKSYQNQDIGFIINDIFNSYLQQEILKIGILNTGREISRVTFNHTTISEALDYLATQTNMRWNVNAYKRLNFMFFGAFHAPYSIHAASNLQSLVTKKNANEYYNRITIRGGEDIITNNIEEFQGDGHTKTFSTRIRINATPIITIDGISQSVGVGGETHSEQFFWNKNERTIFQNPAHAGFFGTMKVVYDGVRTISVTVDNTTEQARKKSIEGGSGVYEFVHYDQDIMTLSAAHALGTSMLEKHAIEEVSVQFDTNETFLEGYPKLLEPGQRLFVNVPQHNINTDTIITDITITEFARQPKFAVSAVCGQNRDYRQFFKKMTAQGKVHIPIEPERFSVLSSATVTAIATCAATASQSIDLTSVASAVPVAVAVASLETLRESQATATAIATSAENRYIATEKTSVATATAVAHTNQITIDGV